MEVLLWLAEVDVRWNVGLETVRGLRLVGDDELRFHDQDPLPSHQFLGYRVGGTIIRVIIE